MLLTKGNTKLGKIHNWSIPAIVTCPGRSKFCESLCYAHKGFFRMRSTADAHQRNLDITRKLGWEQTMIDEIQDNNIKLVRIHVAGDFYDMSYVSDWIRICTACVDTTFYTYTRSWTQPVLCSHICELGALPNVHLWFSVDHDMPEPPRYSGIRIAYLSEKEGDMPEYPVDLVFRNTGNKKWKPAKRMGPHNSQICPYEQGIERKVPLTCETCTLCFKNRKPIDVV